MAKPVEPAGKIPIYDARSGKVNEVDRVVKTDAEKGRRLIADMALELYTIARMLNPCMPATSATIKETVLANKKPETLFPRKE